MVFNLVNSIGEVIFLNKLTSNVSTVAGKIQEINFSLRAISIMCISLLLLNLRNRFLQ